jgi:hypothetical protein
MIDILIPSIRPPEKYQEAFNSALKNSKSGIVNVHIISEGKSYAEAINLVCKKMKEIRSDHDWFFCGADDLLFYENWDVEALKVAEETGKSVIGTNDLHNPQVIAGTHATHYLVKYGYIKSPGGTIDDPDKVLHEYIHNYTDTEFIETAKFRNQFAFAPKSIVEHLHVVWGLASMDAVYEKSLGTSRQDEVTFNQRKHLWKSE